MLGHKKTASDHLQDAINDLKEARNATEEDLGTTIDAAIDKAVEALEKLKQRVGSSS
jgi:hypothetical protein